jgi:cyclohexa-1,5-dienecarbonyl-CoA hydratase
VVESIGKPFADAMRVVEDIYLGELMGTEDANEGLAAFMEKRKPVWRDR